MKKVLLSIVSLSGGGAERVVSVWANKLQNEGYDVSLLLYGRNEKEYPIDPAIAVHTVAADYQSFQALSYFKRVERMRSIVKKIKPDVMISFLPRMQIWMMLATWGIRLRRLETVRVSPWNACGAGRIEQWLWKKCFSRSDAVIVQTAEQAEFFKPRIQKKSIVIPNPISQQYQEHPKQMYLESVTRFVAAGRITEQKNYPIMIEAFQRACDQCEHIRLEIYGTGEESYISEIQKKIDDANLSSKIKLMGRTTDMQSVYHGADAFLMTSDYEGMPNALVEAMVSGLVCISTDCRTGPKDLIDDEKNGFLVKVGDAENIAEAIRKVAGMSQAECEAMGKQAREKILNLCSEENSLQRLIQVIEG